jgi:hypothetical protein
MDQTSTTKYYDEVTDIVYLTPIKAKLEEYNQVSKAPMNGYTDDMQHVRV